MFVFANIYNTCNAGKAPLKACTVDKKTRPLGTNFDSFSVWLSCVKSTQQWRYTNSNCNVLTSSNQKPIATWRTRKRLIILLGRVRILYKDSMCCSCDYVKANTRVSTCAWFCMFEVIYSTLWPLLTRYINRKFRLIKLWAVYSSFGIERLRGLYKISYDYSHKSIILYSLSLRKAYLFVWNAFVTKDHKSNCETCRVWDFFITRPFSAIRRYNMMAELSEISISQSE